MPSAHQLLIHKALQIKEELEADPTRLRSFDQQTQSYARYNLVNRILILLEMPTATDVATYKGWQAQGRQVRKGEHGIKINAPMTRKKKDGQEGEGAKAEPQDSDERGELAGYRQMSVFDISQTDERAEAAHGEIEEVA